MGCLGNKVIFPVRDTRQSLFKWPSKSNLSHTPLSRYVLTRPSVIEDVNLIASKNMASGAREEAHWLRALAALVRDLDLTPRTHKVAFNLL